MRFDIPAQREPGTFRYSGAKRACYVSIFRRKESQERFDIPAQREPSTFRYSGAKRACYVSIFRRKESPVRFDIPAQREPGTFWTGDCEDPSFLRGRGTSLLLPGIDTRLSRASGRDSVFSGTKQLVGEHDVWTLIAACHSVELKIAVDYCMRFEIKSDVHLTMKLTNAGV